LSGFQGNDFYGWKMWDASIFLRRPFPFDLSQSKFIYYGMLAGVMS
jgi:hypothetical protein